MTKLNSPLFLLLAAKEYFENGSLYAGKYFKLKNGEIIVPFDSTTHAKIVVPATNISFGLELALKGCLMYKGVTKWGHDLKELYNLLPEDLRNRIIEHFKTNDHYSNYVIIRMQNGDGSGHGYTERIRYTRLDDEFIPSLLEKHKLAFQYFRYMHEFPGDEVWQFDFREFSNFTFSVIKILGELIDLKIELTKANAKDETAE